MKLEWKKHDNINLDYKIKLKTEGKYDGEDFWEVIERLWGEDRILYLVTGDDTGLLMVKL